MDKIVLALAFIYCLPIILLIVVYEWVMIAWKGRGAQTDYFIKERRDEKSAKEWSSQMERGRRLQEREDEV